MAKSREKAKANQWITVDGKQWRLRMTSAGVECREKHSRTITPVPLRRIVALVTGQPELF